MHRNTKEMAKLKHAIQKNVYITHEKMKKGSGNVKGKRELSTKTHDT